MSGIDVCVYPTRNILGKRRAPDEPSGQYKRRAVKIATIGDYSKNCVLPIVDGQHDDLNIISPDTLSRLILGDLDDQISQFTIVDCRFPYEYDGGHVQGAINLFNKDMIQERLLDHLDGKPTIQPDTQKRRILIFHCEFSCKRGPNLLRFLRNSDRKMNMELYPALHYPEIYLLHGGYQNFFNCQKHLCTPRTYTPMLHSDHKSDLQKYRKFLKS